MDSVCVAPLRLGGLRGKKSTPSVGWEVSVKSHRLESGSCSECMGRHSEWAIKQWYVLFIFVWYNVLGLMLGSSYLMEK
jgi:hypothetical protein